MADVLAFRGKFKEAARLYLKSGNEDKALSMFTDLRMFDAAQVIIFYFYFLFKYSVV